MVRLSFLNLIMLSQLDRRTIYAIYSTDHVHWNKCANSKCDLMSLRLQLKN